MHVMELRKQVRMRTLDDSLCCKRLEWLGHLIIIDGNRLVSRVWGGECVSSRAKGRPRWMYVRIEAEDLARGGVGRQVVLDRDHWKAIVGKIGEPH